MKTERNIFIAFILNFLFSVFEFIGGIIIGSTAIISDAVHDMGDAASIGISYILEKKSKQQPDSKYTYGYARYSVAGSLLSTIVLLIGSSVVIINAVGKIFIPAHINYDGMIVFALLGVCVNFFAAYSTREEGSLNQKAVNLHMLEDVLGWAVVLIGAIIMKFTGFAFIDPILSVGISIFIIIHAIKNLENAADIFLEKAPHNITPDDIKESLTKLKNVVDVHHIHIWSMDGSTAYATMHIVTDSYDAKLKEEIREILRKNSITHSTLEFETKDELCHNINCHTDFHPHHIHHH